VFIEVPLKPGGCFGGAYVGYARVVEFQEAGNPHIRAMIFGDIDFIPADWIRGL
jgi:hypothetical protein